MAGEIGCSSEDGNLAAQQLPDPDTAADNDGEADTDAGRDTSDVEVKLKVAADSHLSDTCDSRHEVNVIERQSAALYVSRLSQFVATLVNNTTSSLDVDKLLQDFSSTICTGIAYV